MGRMEPHLVLLQAAAALLLLLCLEAGLFLMDNIAERKRRLLRKHFWGSNAETSLTRTTLSASQYRQAQTDPELNLELRLPHSLLLLLLGLL